MRKKVNTIPELKKKIGACEILGIDYTIDGTVNHMSIRWDDSIFYTKDDLYDILTHNQLSIKDIKLTSKTIAGSKIECLKIGKEYYILDCVYIEY